MDISLALESAMKQAAAIQNELRNQIRQSQKFNSKLHREISVQNVSGVTITQSEITSPFTDRNMFFKNKGHTSKVSRK